MFRWWLVSLLAAVLVLAGAQSVAASHKEQERNKAVARRLFEEELSRGNWEVGLEIHTPDFVAHAGRRTAGLAEDIESAKEWRRAFPDLVVTVDQMVAEGDRVAVLWTGRGTNTGTGHGFPATGKSGQAGGITIFRFVNGRIAEEWGVIDQLSMLKQLGLIPTP